MFNVKYLLKKTDFFKKKKVVAIKRILVLAGGGIRGAIQLDTLLLIEEHYGRPIHQIYDLIVGTSVGAITGGILATGLLDMQTYKAQFIQHVPLIFRRPWWRFGLFRPLYEADNVRRMWNNFFGDRELTLKDVQTKFACTAVNLCDDATHVFESWNPKMQTESLYETIAKSFAAPYYFGQYRDEEKKVVWTDGGVGVSNSPLDWAYTESIELGWQYEKREFTLLGTGAFNSSIPYAKLNSFTDRRKILRYMNPLRGGFARVQSTLNQIRRMRVIAQYNPDIDFKVFQLQIPKKYEPIDKVKYLNQYLYYGKIMASQVASYFDGLQYSEENTVDLQNLEQADLVEGEFCSEIPTRNRKEIILYLDLFKANLKKTLLIRAIIEYYRQIKRKFPDIALHLFFYTKTNDPFLTNEITTSAELAQIIDKFLHLRDQTYSNLENGLIYCLSYFATHTSNPPEEYKLIVLSDLPSLWGDEIKEVVFQVLEQIKQVKYSIDIIRFGAKENFPDNEKLKQITSITGGCLEYKHELIDLLRANPLAFLIELVSPK